MVSKSQAGKLIVLVIFAVGVALALALRMLPADDTAGSKPSNLAPLKTSQVGEFRGIALQLHNGQDDHPYEQYIDEIARTGANTISLAIHAHQENGSSTSIFVDIRKTPGDERLEQLIAHARKRGLRVVLMPVVLLENTRDGEWRGKIAPTSWDDWWEDYTGFIEHYAKLAQRSNVEVFLVGSELLSTEKYTKRWRKLIRLVRSIYSGRLAYSANWDHYRPIEWWDALDIVGMTTYYDLTEGKPATVERMIEAWKPIKKDILEWQAKINRPIMFTEVGWPNQISCGQYPWNYYANQDKPDPAAQANCFEAFFQTWINEKAVAGFLVWEWQNHPGHDLSEKDTSYVPKGKPAEQVVRKYFRMPSPHQSKQNKPAEKKPHAIGQ